MRSGEDVEGRPEAVVAKKKKSVISLQKQFASEEGLNGKIRVLDRVILSLSNSFLVLRQHQGGKSFVNHAQNRNTCEPRPPQEARPFRGRREPRGRSETIFPEW